jgi:hypothetical protein
MSRFDWTTVSFVVAWLLIISVMVYAGLVLAGAI